MIWEFWDLEESNGKKATALDPVVNGQGRIVSYHNDPKNQRMCECQKCGITIPREVPRLTLKASYYYGSGNYCMTCAKDVLKERVRVYQMTTKELGEEQKKMEELIDLTEKTENHPWYAKKMALGKMLQVIKE